MATELRCRRMLAYRRPLELLTPAEYAERFTHKLAISHDRSLKLAKAIARTYASGYQERGIEPESAAALWASEFPSKPRSPARRAGKS